MPTEVTATPLPLQDLLTRASHQLLKQADEIINRELLTSDGIEYRIAVVLAHAACDLQTEEAIGELVAIRDVEYLREAMLMTRKVNLGDERARRVYQALSGDSPWLLVNGVRRAPWWDDWTTCAEKRDRVAHRGENVTVEEADASVKACKSYVNHLINVVTDVRSKHRLRTGTLA